MYPFERFTEKAKKVLTLAQDEADKSHHSYIGTEHLLLGLLREEEGHAAKVLANLGVEIDKVRDTIDSVLGRNERITVQQIIPTSRVKKVIEIAFEEAKRMNNTHVGTEHLLLGLLVEGEGVAAHVLEDFWVNLDKVRHELDSLLKDQGPEDEPSSGSQSRWGTYRYSDQKPESFLPARGELGDLELFTSEARSALALGEEEAVRSTVGYFGTEHLLAGLVRQAEGSAARVLLVLGVDLLRVRAELAKNGWSSPRLTVQNVLPTSELRRAVAILASKAAAAGPTGRVDTQHLLLAITTVNTDPATHLLVALGVDVVALREQLQGGQREPRG
ncbi:MAG: Clp protease N-terminal domain-containing protein [Candidatus Dormiibacterota bacterium]